MTDESLVGKKRATSLPKVKLLRAKEAVDPVEGGSGGNGGRRCNAAQSGFFWRWCLCSPGGGCGGDFKVGTQRIAVIPGGSPDPSDWSGKLRGPAVFWKGRRLGPVTSARSAELGGSRPLRTSPCAPVRPPPGPPSLVGCQRWPPRGREVPMSASVHPDPSQQLEHPSLTCRLSTSESWLQEERRPPLWALRIPGSMGEGHCLERTRWSAHGSV